MVKYNTGIEFCICKKINRLSINIGQVKCIFNETENTRAIFRSGKTYSYKILLQSLDIDSAIDCIELLCAAKSVIDSSIEIGKDKFISNINVDECKRLGKQCYMEYLSNTIQVSVTGPEWYMAILVAEKAISDIHSRIAVLKYYNARMIYDIHPMDLHPGNFTEIHFSILDKLRFAYSIIDINSIVEELGIEIRASKQNPSVVNDEWNVKVLNDLEERLIKSKIDPNKLIPWLSRGTSQRPFKSTVISNKALCSWSDNEQIMDFEISIKNAILELDYQRDKLASHCVGNRIEELCIIDLENAFCLLRTILLDYFAINIDMMEQ